MSRKQLSICICLLLLTATGLSLTTRAQTAHFNVEVIAHRGASGYLPEHTLAAYELAIQQGADFIEPDLVITKDNHLVSLHDVSLSRTTNIADLEQFADRKRTSTVGYDWFVSDFTLAELKQLTTRQAYEGRSTQTDGLYEIPTFEEVIDLILEHEKQTGEIIGIYPELKRPDFFPDADFPQMVINALKEKGLESQSDRVYLQSFDDKVLKALNQITDLPLVMLVRPSSRLTPTTPNMSIDEIAKFADAVGANKFLVFEPDGNPTDLVNEAKTQGLRVHVWTIRDDQVHPAFRNVEEELTALIGAGVDGVFTDFPDTAVRQLHQMNQP